MAQLTGNVTDGGDTIRWNNGTELNVSFSMLKVPNGQDIPNELRERGCIPRRPSGCLGVADGYSTIFLAGNGYSSCKSNSNLHALIQEYKKEFPDAFTASEFSSSSSDSDDD